MYASAGKEHRELARVLRELEGAPLEVRTAAAQRIAAWTQRHAPMAVAESGAPSLSARRAVALFLALAVPTALLVQYASSATCTSAPVLIRASHRTPLPQPSLAGGSGADCNVAAAIRAAGSRAAGSAVAPLPPSSSCKREYPAHEAFMHPQEGLRKLRPQRNTSDYPLIIVVGHGKTATKSLNKAFVLLGGYRTAHFYGAGVYGLLFNNAAETVDYDFRFSREEPSHVDAVLDTPVVDFYNEILLTYPNAKVILTVRDVKGWMRSRHKFYSYYSHGCHKWLAPWRRGAQYVYGTECPSREQALKRYLQHNRNVYDAVPVGRLLVMDIAGGDGWQKLCRFIGRPVPTNITFPSRH